MSLPDLPTYDTLQEHCPQCGGSDVETDYDCDTGITTVQCESTVAGICDHQWLEIRGTLDRIVDALD